MGIFGPGNSLTDSYFAISNSPRLNGLLYGRWRKIEGKDLEPHPSPSWLPEGFSRPAGAERKHVQYGGYEFEGRLEETDQLTQDKNLRRIESVLGNITCNFEFLENTTFGHTFSQELHGPSRIVRTYFCFSREEAAALTCSSP